MGRPETPDPPVLFPGSAPGINPALKRSLPGERPSWRTPLSPDELVNFEAALLPHFDAAYGLARYLTRDDHDAEDVVQEAYLRAVRHFAGYRGGDGRAWLLTIVRRTCYTLLKRRRTEQPISEVEEQADPATDPVGTLEKLDREALRERLTQAIEALPMEFREVIVLRDLEDLSYKEIAAALAVPIGTVMSRLSRARRRLQVLLAAPSGAKS